MKAKGWGVKEWGNPTVVTTEFLHHCFSMQEWGHLDSVDIEAVVRPLTTLIDGFYLRWPAAVTLGPAWSGGSTTSPAHA